MERIDFERVIKEINNIEGVKIMTLHGVFAEFEYKGWKIYFMDWQKDIAMKAINQDGTTYRIILEKTKKFYDEVITALKGLKEL